MVLQSLLVVSVALFVVGAYVSGVLVSDIFKYDFL